MEDSLKELSLQKEESIRRGDFTEASLVQKDQEQVEKKAGGDEEKRFRKKTSSSHPSVTEEDIAEVVSAWTKVPVQKLAEERCRTG